MHLPKMRADSKSRPIRRHSEEPGTQPQVAEKHHEQPSSDSIPEDEVKPVPVVDKLPAAVWIVAIAGAAERFAYYSLAAPLRREFLVSVAASQLTMAQKTTFRISEAVPSQGPWDLANRRPPT